MNRFLTAALTLTLTPFAAQAARIAVFTPTGPGVEANEAQVLGALFTHALSSHQQTPIPPVTADPALLEAGGSSSATAGAAAATKLGADQFLTIEILQLQSKQVVSARLSDKNGNVVQSAQSEATGLDEMPTVTERMVVALLEGKAVKETRTLDTVTDQDTGSQKLVSARSMALLSGGLTVPFASTDIAPMVTALILQHVELKDAWIDYGGGILVPGGADDGDASYGGIFGEIGAGYHLTHTAMSPFISGGLDVRLAGGDEVSGVGLVPFVAVGLETMRDSSMRFIVQARVGQNVLGLEKQQSVPGSYYDEERTVGTLYPTELGLLVGVGF